QNAITAGHAGDSIEHGQGLTQEMCNTMAQKGLFYSPTILEYTQPEIEDTDAKNTDGKYGIVPIFKKNVRMCIATKGIVTVFGSGSQGAAWREGSNALEFSALVNIGGMTPAAALQAGTINAATEMRWRNDIGSITKGKVADIVAGSGDPLADISETERVKFVMKGGEVFRNDLTPGTRGAEFFTRQKSVRGEPEKLLLAEVASTGVLSRGSQVRASVAIRFAADLRVEFVWRGAPERSTLRPRRRTARGSSARRPARRAP